MRVFFGRSDTAWWSVLFDGLSGLGGDFARVDCVAVEKIAS
jgi:hypothetical protein